MAGSAADALKRANKVFEEQALAELGPLDFAAFTAEAPRRTSIRWWAWRWLGNPLVPLFSRTELAAQLAEAMTLCERQRQTLIADGALSSFGRLTPWTILHLGGALPESVLQILRKRDDVDATAADVRWLREQRARLIDLVLNILPALRARLLDTSRVTTAPDVFAEVLRAFPPADLRRLLSLEQGMRRQMPNSPEPRVITAGHWPFGGLGLLLAVFAHVDAELAEAVTFDAIVRALPPALRPRRDGPSYADLWRTRRSADIDAALDMWPELLVRRRDALARSDAVIEAALASIPVPDLVELPSVHDKKRPLLRQQAPTILAQVAQLVEAGVDLPDLTKLLPRSPEAAHRLEQRQNGWWGVDAAREVYLGDSVGLARVARLLAEPGKSFKAEDLVAAAPSTADQRVVASALADQLLAHGDVDGPDRELSEVDAKRMRQLMALKKKIEIGEDTGGDTTALKEQVADLANALKATRSSREAPTAERARKTVTASIRAEQQRLSHTFPALADAVGRIDTGRFCVFKPGVGERWAVTFRS